MAQFYGSMRGSGGEVTKTGTKHSGIRVYIHGWSIGIIVACRVDANGNDICTAYETGGSDNPSTIGKSFEVKARRRR